MSYKSAIADLAVDLHIMKSTTIQYIVRFVYLVEVRGENQKKNIHMAGSIYM